MVSDKLKHIPEILFPGTSDVLWIITFSNSLGSQLLQQKENQRKTAKISLYIYIFHLNKYKLFSLAPKKTLLLAWLRNAFFNLYNEDAATGLYSATM